MGPSELGESTIFPIDSVSRVRMALKGRTMSVPDIINYAVDP